MVLRASIESDYDENIKNQVDCAISLLNEVYEGYERGEYSLDKAKEMGASLLRDLRYGDGGYFWADTYEGVNVVLLGNTTEGTNRMDAKDTNGNSYMKDIISAGRNPDGGYVDYMFPKAGETEASPKRAYSKSFEPFEWVIGTGNYIDYINTTVAHETQAVKANARSAMNKIAGMGGALAVIVLAVCVYMAVELSRSFKYTLGYIGNITRGDFTQELPKQLQNRRDDFGILSENLENMKKQVSGLILEVKEQSNTIDEVVDSVKTNVLSLTGNIEDVSATTQELAAGMEETAASSDTVKSMANEIEGAAKNIATRSQEGAQQGQQDGPAQGAGHHAHQAVGHGHGDVHHHGGEGARQDGHEHGGRAGGGSLPEIHSLFLAAHAALQHHNGVIHDHADGDDEGRAGHQVDVEAGKVQQDHCQQDGQRHADAHDQAGPQVAEEDEQHDHG